MKKILKRICVFVIFAFVISITNVFALDTEVIRYGGKGSDYFLDTILDGDNLIAVGQSNSTDIDDITNNGLFDAVIVKYDKNNSIVWHKNYGTTKNDSLNSIAVVDDGYIAVGYKNETKGNSYDATGIFVKYNKNGTIVWDKDYKSSEGTKFSDIEKVNSDEYILLGEKYEDGISIPIILKIDGSGNTIGEEIPLEDYEDYFVSKVLVTPEQEYIVLLYSSDSAILKLDKEGNIKWDKTYNMNGKQQPVFEDAIITSNGTYLVVGGNNKIATPGGATSQDLAFMLEYDKSGNLLNEMIFENYKQSRFNKVVELNNQYIVVAQVANMDRVDIDVFTGSNFLVKIFKFDKNKQFLEEENLGIFSTYMASSDSFSVAKQSDSDYFIVVNTIDKLLNTESFGGTDAAIIKTKKVFVDDNEDENEKTLWERFVEEYKKTELINLIGSFEKNSINITSTSDSLKIEFSNEKEKTITNFTYKDGIVTYVPASSEEGIISDGTWIANCIYALANLKGYDTEQLNLFMDQDRKFTLEEDGVEFEILEYDSGEISGTTFSSFKLDIKNGLKSLSKFEKENDDTIVEKVPVPDTLSNPSVIAIAIGVLLIFAGVILYFGIIKNKLKKS